MSSRILLATLVVLWFVGVSRGLAADAERVRVADDYATNTLKDYEIKGDVKIYPLPHMPVVKDLVPDLSHAYGGNHVFEQVTFEIQDGAVLGADEPVDARRRKRAAEGRRHGKGMNDIAESTESDDEDAVHYFVRRASSSRVECCFGSPTMAVRPP